ncbi:HAD family phosphatase [Candidatus Kaiserbacteria bacterium]|nr:HAD family phosphatase [Candidatus Kaiserbacteria bacterium]
MNKAFIFDMDGVIVNSEPVWEELEREYLPKMFGAEAAAKIPNLIGYGLTGVIELATSLGATFNREDVIAEHEAMAAKVYERAQITPGADSLIEELHAKEFRLGLVSQSKQDSIEKVLQHLPSKNRLEIVISLHQHQELKPKPAPDGYLAGLRALDADSSFSFVLEDSNFGIEAGKAAGCFVIAFRGHLMPGYEQKGAHAYADTMEEVANIVNIRSKTR